jgi:hypothetical protein
LGLVDGVAVDQATQIGLDEYAFEIAPPEKFEQRLDALGRRCAGVEKQNVLSMQTASSAANVVADLPDESLLAHGDPGLLR